MAEKPASRSDAEIVVVRTNDAALPTRSPNADPETVDMRLLRTIASIVPADLPPISQLGLETTLAAMADATKAAIAAAPDCWSGWCGAEGRSPLPADPADPVRHVRERTSVVLGKRASARVDLGCWRIIQKKTTSTQRYGPALSVTTISK